MSLGPEQDHVSINNAVLTILRLHHHFIEDALERQSRIIHYHRAVAVSRNLNRVIPSKDLPQVSIGVEHQQRSTLCIGDNRPLVADLLQFLDKSLPSFVSCTWNFRSLLPGRKRENRFRGNFRPLGCHFTVIETEEIQGSPSLDRTNITLLIVDVPLEKHLHVPLPKERGPLWSNPTVENHGRRLCHREQNELVKPHQRGKESPHSHGMS